MNVNVVGPSFGVKIPDETARKIRAMFPVSSLDSFKKSPEVLAEETKQIGHLRKSAGLSPDENVHPPLYVTQEEAKEVGQ